MKIPRDDRGTRSLLFSYWARQLKGAERARVREALSLLERRMPHEHRALIDAHVHGHRDICWAKEASAVSAIRTLLATNLHTQRKAA